MSKMRDALNKFSIERAELQQKQQAQPVSPQKRDYTFRFDWGYRVLIIGIVITIFYAFNYTDDKNAVPLSEIFPDEETMPMVTEYDIAQDQTLSNRQTRSVAIQDEEIKIDKSSVEEAAVEIVAANEFQNIPFTIQIASFRSKEKAQKVLKEVQDKNYSAYIVTRDVGTSGFWHRIYVGRFESKIQAQQLLLVLVKDYKDSFIITPKLR